MPLNLISQDPTQEIDDGMASLYQWIEQFNDISGPTSIYYGDLRASDVQDHPYIIDDQNPIQYTNINPDVRASNVSKSNPAEKRVLH